MRPSPRPIWVALVLSVVLACDASTPVDAQSTTDNSTVDAGTPASAADDDDAGPMVIDTGGPTQRADTDSAGGAPAASESTPLSKPNDGRSRTASDAGMGDDGMGDDGMRGASDDGVGGASEEGAGAGWTGGVAGTGTAGGGASGGDGMGGSLAQTGGSGEGGNSSGPEALPPGPCTQETTDGNGTVQSRMVNTYDAMGNLTEWDIDRDGDGIVDQKYVYTYDAVGRVLTETTSNRVGGMQTTTFTRYTYDERGNWIRLEQGTTASNISFVTERTYDESDQLLSQTTDTNNDGVVEIATTNTYTADGRLLFVANDTNADGEPDDTTEFNYDASGILVEVVHRDASEDSPRTTTYENDENGKPVVETHYAGDDPNPTMRTLRSYDKRGNLLTQEIDENGDGSVDRALTYTYDDADRLVASDEDYTSGTEQLHVTVTYDSAGRELTRLQTSDAGNASLFNQSTVNTYDEDGQVLSTRTDDDLDGVDDSVTTATLDERGRIVLVESDYGNDGEVDSRIVNTYECWD